MSHRRLVAALSLLLAAGCADPKAKSPGGPAGTSPAAGAQDGGSSSCDSLGSGVVASADGIEITGTEVENATSGQTFQQRSQIFEERSNWAQNELAKRLIEREAKKEGLTMEAFLTKQVGAAAKASDADAKMFYQSQQSQMKKPDGTTATFEEMKDKIKNYLDQQGEKTAQQNYVSKLMETNHAKVDMEAPEPKVVEVATADFPSQGDKNAPVTVVEFSDFQCPACKQAFTRLDDVLKKYPGKVHFVYRDFPLLSRHPFAFPAAVAANCALAQSEDKYWEYHHLLFTNQQALAPDDLKKYAQQTKLDMDKFAACQKDEKVDAAVRKELADGDALGINSTPTFFVNGRMVPGANLGEVSRLIEKELKKAGS